MSPLVSAAHETFLGVFVPVALLGIVDMRGGSNGECSFDMDNGESEDDGTRSGAVFARRKAGRRGFRWADGGVRGEDSEDPACDCICV